MERLEVDFNNDAVQVVLAKEHLPAKRNQIVIYPSNNDWNDFGYIIKARFRANIHQNDKIFFHDGDLLIGLLLDDNLKAKYKDFVYSRKRELDFVDWTQTCLENSQCILKEDAPDFFTMLPDLQSYRRLVNAYGVETTNWFLEFTNDIVFRKKSTKNESWIKEVTKTETFTLGFMRNSDSFFTFHNADSILDGLDQEDFSAISNLLKLSFQLDGFNNEHRFELKYSGDSIIPCRINILIGENGIGKSQCLYRFCQTVLRANYKGARLLDISENAYSGRVMINRLLAIGTPGETVNTFPHERPKIDRVYYRRLHLTRKGRAKRSRSIPELMVQLARSEELVGEMTRWKIFKRSIKSIIDVEKLYVRMSDGSYSKVIDFHSNQGEQDSLKIWGNIDLNAEPLVYHNSNYHPLSSGQLTFFKFALLCTTFIENGSFVLMDEPETHLHPNYISQFVGLLDDILERTGSYALIATHSAYFVREVSRKQVHILKSSDNIISVVPPRLRTFGSDIDSISQFVFDEDIESQLTSKIYDRVKGENFEKIESDLKGEISLAALMDLKARMEEDEKARLT